MIFVHGFRADYKKVYKPFATLGVLAVIAIIANNNIEGANFMYLAKGTSGDSIANVLPQDIGVRLVLYLGILIVLFVLLSLPQIIPQIKAHRRKKAENAEAVEEAIASTMETPTETVQERLEVEVAEMRDRHPERSEGSEN